MDTKVFDDAIAVKETAVQTAQAAVDGDIFISEQKAAQAKSQKLSDEQNAKAAIEVKKTQFVSLQAEIESADQQIALLEQRKIDIEQQKLDLENSVK